MNKLVSIIIPVYNVEEYLPKCLESVINQSYKNLEIILVDDGSTDKSGKICDDYAYGDDRVLVCHQKNQGLSVARNKGISLMTGDYVYFLDSDDFIGLNTIELLFNNIKKSKCDIAIGKIVNFTTENQQNSTNQYEGTTAIYDTENCLKEMLLNKGIGHEACGKLFSVSLWENQKFPDGKLYEDYATIYYVVANAKKIIVCGDAIYFYRMRIGSIMNSEIKENNFMLLDISDEVTSRLIAMNRNIEDAAVRLNVVTYLKLLKMILDVGYNAYPDVQSRIIYHVKKNKKVFLESKCIRFVDKLKLYAILVGKLPFHWLYKINDIFKKNIMI